MTSPYAKPRRKKKEAPSAPPVPPTQCLYETPGEGRCPSQPEQHGHCHKHVRFSPFERSVEVQLSSIIQAARTSVEDLGRFILLHYVVNSSLPVPEDTARSYRNMHYRYTYLICVRDSRRHGDALPVEVTARTPE